MSPGQHRLGQYELQQRLESDILSESWKAFDTQRRRYVIVRILHVGSPAATDLLPRFRRETQSLTSLRHPNIAQVLDIRATDEEAYLVTDYVEGQSLADYIHATSYQGEFPTVTEIGSLLAPVGAALDFAHRQGIIHGRLKPGNILLDKHGASAGSLGEAKLVGFGLHNIQAPVTLPIEDAYYISPELVQGQTENIRCDLYSLGVILYELCTGTRPFQGETAAEVMMQHLHATPQSPALINPHIRPAMTAVIMRSLAKNPQDRFPTASAMLAAITRAADSSTPGLLGLSGPFAGGVSSSGWRNQSIEEMHSPTYPLTSRQESGKTPTASPAEGSLPPLEQSAAQGPARPAEQAPLLLSQQTSANVPGSLRMTPAPAALPLHPASQASARAKQNRRGWLIALVALLIVLVLGSAAGAFVLYPRLTANTTTQLVGHAFFVSSGLVSQNSNQGITDGLQIVLQGLPLPQGGKSYYAWLLGDNDTISASPAILLATLPETTGRITVTYAGDAQHSNLLARYSRFLITEENAGLTPLNPSLDVHTWRYFARFSTDMAPAMGANMGQNAMQHSVLDHLRHLLSEAPELKAAGLTGGLDTWLFRNTLKILEWTGSARDAYTSKDVGLIRRQTVRVLDYLDGQQYVGTEHIPPDVPTLLVDPTIARVALLEFDVQNQNPPGYLKNIGDHLRDMTQMPGVTPEQKALAIQVNQATNNVQVWLDAVHKDAQQLIHMTPAQLQQPGTQALLDHMFVQANYAFVGQTDPYTNQVKAGVAQIHYDIQRLATFDIAVCTPASAATLCA